PKVRHQLQRHPTWIKCYSYLTITSGANWLRTAYGDIDRKVSTGGAVSGSLSAAAASRIARRRDRGPSEAAGLGSRNPGASPGESSGRGPARSLAGRLRPPASRT